jgi:hypothetical protein
MSDGMNYAPKGKNQRVVRPGEFILDCLNRTEKSMTQDHVFKAAELAVKAQLQAQWIAEAPGDTQPA